MELLSIYMMRNGGLVLEVVHWKCWHVLGHKGKTGACLQHVLDWAEMGLRSCVHCMTQ